MKYLSDQTYAKITVIGITYLVSSISIYQLEYRATLSEKGSTYQIVVGG